MGQLFKGEIKRLAESGRFTKEPGKAFIDIQNATWTHAEREFKVATVVGGTMGNQAAVGQALSATVIAMPIADTPTLFQLDHKCSPEEATERLPFISVGSGQSLADPFLAFLRKIFWPSKLPLLSEGILATLWCLEQAISLNTGGVSAPIQIMTLSRNHTTKRWEVSELSEDELSEHRQNIADAERALSQYRTGQQGTSANPPVPMPLPG